MAKVNTRVRRVMLKQNDGVLVTCVKMSYSPQKKSFVFKGFTKDSKMFHKGYPVKNFEHKEIGRAYIEVIEDVIVHI